MREGGFHEIHHFLKMIPYRKEKMEEDFYRWEVAEKSYMATGVQFAGFFGEYLSGVFEHLYPFDYRGKTVLDIGGFIGDSALFFLEKKAKYCLVCEPSSKNVKAMEYNLQNYKNQIEIVPAALASQDGLITLSSSFPEGDEGFGIKVEEASAQTGILQLGAKILHVLGCRRERPWEREHHLCCQGLSIATLLRKKDFDVVKIDCEGAEIYLADVEEDLLRSVPFWMIETHSLKIHAIVEEKFKRAGFTQTLLLLLSSNVQMVHFKY